jgi:hypothetical protein
MRQFVARGGQFSSDRIEHPAECMSRLRPMQAELLGATRDNLELSALPPGGAQPQANDEQQKQ